MKNKIFFLALGFSCVNSFCFGMEDGEVFALEEVAAPVPVASPAACASVELLVGQFMVALNQYNFAPEWLWIKEPENQRKLHLDLTMRIFEIRAVVLEFLRHNPVNAILQDDGETLISYYCCVERDGEENLKNDFVCAAAIKRLFHEFINRVFTLGDIDRSTDGYQFVQNKEEFDALLNYGVKNLERKRCQGHGVGVRCSGKRRI